MGERRGGKRDHAADLARVKSFGFKLVEQKSSFAVIHGIRRDLATGEYIGVAKFTAEGASRLLAHYQRCRQEFSGRPFHQARTFEKAYLIHLLQEMVESGVSFAHVDTPGGYMEIDTQQDFELARQIEAGRQFRDAVDLYWAACERLADQQLESFAAEVGGEKRGSARRSRRKLRERSKSS